MRSPKSGVIWVLLVLFFGIGSATAAFGQCRSPGYSRGRDYGASVYVSIKPSDFTFENLICLGQLLRKQRKARESFSVTFFSSREAARQFQPPVEGYPVGWRNWASELHAMYSFEKGKETIDILPLGFDDQISADRTSSTIDLPIGTGVPKCRIEVEGRCLMAVTQKTIYPNSALAARISGDIMLKGVIRVDGSVTDVRIEGKAIPTVEQEPLVNTAIENLKSWHFDARGNNNPFQITYSYVLDYTLPAGIEIKFKWAPPGGLTISAKPIK